MTSRNGRARRAIRALTTVPLERGGKEESDLLKDEYDQNATEYDYSNDIIFSIYSDRGQLAVS